MSFHERAVEADKEAHKMTMARLLKKYPYIDLSRFKILTHMVDNDVKAHPEVFFKDTTKGDTDVPMEGDDKARFWDNQ